MEKTKSEITFLKFNFTGRTRNMLKEQDVKQYLNEKNIALQENASIIGVLFPNKVALYPI